MSQAKSEKVTGLVSFRCVLLQNNDSLTSASLSVNLRFLHASLIESKREAHIPVIDGFRMLEYTMVKANTSILCFNSDSFKEN